MLTKIPGPIAGASPLKLEDVCIEVDKQLTCNLLNPKLHVRFWSNLKKNQKKNKTCKAKWKKKKKKKKKSSSKRSFKSANKCKQIDWGREN